MFTEHLTYKHYIPKKAIPFVAFLIEQHNFELKIVNQRATKHGDFRQLPNGKFKITVNNNLNKYQFLLTLVHEIAHYVTHKKFGRVKPHGTEWKLVFKHLMLPFITPEIYPEHILKPLANYIKNAKASTDSDAVLALALKNNTASLGQCFIFALPKGTLFTYKNTIYKKGAQRRTRFECLQINTNKTYLFNKNTEVKAYENR